MRQILLSLVAAARVARLASVCARSQSGSCSNVVIMTLPKHGHDPPYPDYGMQRRRAAHFGTGVAIPAPCTVNPYTIVLSSSLGV